MPNTKKRKASDAKHQEGTKKRKASDAKHPKGTKKRKASDAKHPKGTKKRKASDVKHPKDTKKRKASDVKRPKGTKKRKASDAKHPKDTKKRKASDVKHPKGTKELNLVIFSKDFSPDKNWRGEIPLTPIAVCGTVCVFPIDNAPRIQYWETPGSKAYTKAVDRGRWLPRVVAGEMCKRITEEGEDSVAGGRFIEEACTKHGRSVLVVDATLLKKRYKAFCSMLMCGRLVSKSVLHGFFVKHVLPNSTMAIALKFIQNGTSLEEARNTSFESLSSKLQEDSVNNASGDMLLRIIQLGNWRRRNYPLISGTVKTRIFLAAYMITARPNHVFETIGDLERAVLSASKPMLEAFHKTAEALSKGVPWHQVKKEEGQHLLSLLCDYLRAFKDWKIIDERKLGGRLRHALRALEDQERALSALEDNELNQELRRELIVQQQRLREKLKNIAGEKELAAHDAGLRAAAGSAIVNVESFSETAPPPGHVKGMSNEELAWEMLLDPDFALDGEPGMSAEKLVHIKIRETFERAFWESLVEDLSANPPSYSRVLSVVTEIKTGIKSLAAGFPEAHKIGKIVDVELITRRLSKDSLDLKGCENLVDAIVAVLVSMHVRMRSDERRKETVKKWADVREKMVNAPEDDNVARARAICAALELLLERVHAVRVDTANHKLKKIAPVIREHGVDYVSNHFVKKLANKTISLQHTSAWIAHTVSGLVRGKDTRVNVEGLVEGKPEDFENTLYIAIVDLIADYPHWGGITREGKQKDEVPETMQLNFERIKGFNRLFHGNVASSIILVTVEQKVRESIRDAGVRTRLTKAVQKIVLENPPNPTAPQNTIKLVMEELSSEMAASQLGLLKGILEKNVKKDSVVYAPMTRILKRVWYHLIKEKSIPPRCQLPEVANVLIPKITEYSLSLATVAALNKKVHVKRYNEIIATATKSATATEAKTAQ